MIETRSLTRRYGDRTAVDGLSFSVAKGEIVGFLGPNGAGKSTTLKMLAGFLPPTEGSATVAGHDIIEARTEAQRCIGFMPESMPLHPEMRVDEYLRFRAEIKGVRGTSKIKASVDRAIELADVKDVPRRLIGELSKGYRQRVGLADALVASPPLLILDEPTEGLDPNQILKFRDLLAGLAKEHTIFLSTHILPEVEAVCSRVIIIHRGKAVADGTLDAVRAELLGSARSFALTVRPPEAAREKWGADPTAEAVALAVGVEGVTVTTATYEAGVARLDLALEGEAERLEAMVARCVAQGVGVRELTRHGRSLETVFHELTTVESGKS